MIDQVESQSQLYNVNIQPEFAFGRFRIRMDHETTAWRTILRSIEEETFWQGGAQRIKSMPNLALNEDAPRAKADLVRDENLKCFLNIMRAFIDYIDTLIGLKEMTSDEIEVRYDLNGEDAIRSYIDEEIGEYARQVGARTYLTNPAKLDKLAQVDQKVAHAVREYFQLRRALEHHKGRPLKAIEFCVWKLQLIIDEVHEFTGEPYQIEAGPHTFHIKFPEAGRTLRADQDIFLTEEDIEHFLQSMSVIVGPELLKAAFPPSANTTNYVGV